MLKLLSGSEGKWTLSLSMNLDPKPGSPSVDSHSEGCPCLSFSRNFVFLLLSHLYNRIPACEIKNYNINLLCYEIQHVHENMCDNYFLFNNCCPTYLYYVIKQCSGVINFSSKQLPIWIYLYNHVAQLQANSSPESFW